MSLKAFHIVFIIVSTLLMAGFSAWSFDAYFTGGRHVADLCWGIGCLLGVAALLVYGRYFLKKLKNISYL